MYFRIPMIKSRRLNTAGTTTLYCIPREVCYVLVDMVPALLMKKSEWEDARAKPGWVSPEVSPKGLGCALGSGVSPESSSVSEHGLMGVSPKLETQRA